MYVNRKFSQDVTEETTEEIVETEQVDFREVLKKVGMVKVCEEKLLISYN